MGKKNNYKRQIHDRAFVCSEIYDISIQADKLTFFMKNY